MWAAALTLLGLFLPLGTSAPVVDESPAPAQVRQVTDLLDWQPVHYPRSATVSTTGAWTLATSDQADRWIELTGPGFHRRWDLSDTGVYVDQVHLDRRWAVFGVLSSDQRAAAPLYTAVDLRSRQVSRIDRHLVGKALYAEDYFGGRLLVDVRRAGQWCLGYVDLASRRLDDAACPEPGHLFAAPRLTGEGLSAGQYDPDEDLGGRSFACVTYLDLSGESPVPFRGTQDCRPRDDAMLAPGGPFWSERVRADIPSDSRFRAIARGDPYRLGKGATASAVWCHGAVYFRPSDPDPDVDELVRWDGSGTLATVYRGQPVGSVWCSGDHLMARVDDIRRRQITASLR